VPLSFFFFCFTALHILPESGAEVVEERRLVSMPVEDEAPVGTNREACVVLWKSPEEVALSFLGERAACKNKFSSLTELDSLSQYESSGSDLEAR
jgi:hypothetical protein